MATSASLVVKISADINDFTRQLDAMTKGVDRAAKKIAGIGEALTIGLTVPLVAAGVAFAKLAADNEETAGRFERVFGSLSGAVDESIKGMMKSVPQTEAELQKLATQTDLMLQGMDVAPSRAAGMSDAMLKLAADMAAVGHVPITETLDALDKALAGRARGLIEYGMSFTKLELQQEAYRLGILHTGNTLTEAGTAQAAYNLIMAKSSLVQGESKRTADLASQSFAFLKRDVTETGESFGKILLPALADIVNGIRSAVDWINGLSDSTKTWITRMLVLAAAVGPAVYILAKLTQGFFALKSAFTLLTAGGSIATVFAEATNPIGQVLLAIGLLSAAVITLAAAWNTASNSLTGYLARHNLLPKTASATGRAFEAQQAQDILGKDPGLDAAIKRQNAALAAVTGKGGATEFNAKDPLAQLQEQAALVEKAFTRAIDNGGNLSGLFGQINVLHERALDLINQQGGALNKESVGAREIADQMQRLQDIRNVINAGPAQLQGAINAIVNRPIDVGAQGATAAVDAAEAYRKDLAKRLGQSALPQTFNVGQEAIVQSRASVVASDQDLALREALVGLPNGFNATKQAAVELAETQRSAAEGTALQFARIQIGLQQFGIKLGNLSPAMQAVTVGMLNAVTTIAQGIAARLSGGGPNAGLGGALGSALGGALVGSQYGLAFGPLGAAAGAIAGSLIGGLFDPAKKATDNAASSLDNLSTAVNKVTASITNIPQFFKVELERFRAAPITQPAPPVQPPPPPITNPIFGGGATPQPATHSIVVQGDLVVNSSATNAKDLMADIYQQAAKQKATGSRAPFVFAPNAAFAG